MSTTIPIKFEGIPTLTDVKVDTITQWYHSALGDADKAMDMDDAYYYSGLTSGLESTLKLLYEAAEEVTTKVVKTGPGGFKRAVIITGVVGLAYLYLKNDKKIKATIKQGKNAVEDSFNNGVKAVAKEYGIQHPKASVEDKLTD